MASTAIYSSRNCGQLKMADQTQIPEVLRKEITVFVALNQVSLCCYSGYLTFPL